MKKLIMAFAIVLGMMAFAPQSAKAGVYVRAPGVSVGVGIGRPYYRPYRYYRGRAYYGGRYVYPRRVYRAPRYRRRARRRYYRW